MGVHAVPAHVLELILLRLDSPICLLRAASTCKLWRRVIACAGFLHQFRSLHGPPPVAAVYYDRPRKPRQCPDFVCTPSVHIDGRFFSLDFLPDSGATPWVWRVEDSRGSLLLLDRLPGAGGSAWYRDMVVCEPLTRRYARIAPRAVFRGYDILGAHLIDGEAGGIGVSNFRVVCRLHSDGLHRDAGVLAVGRHYHRRSWRKVSIDRLMLAAGPSMELSPTSLCWYNGGRRMVGLDRSTGEFSSVVLPEVEDWDFHKETFSSVVVPGGDGEARIVLSGASGDLKVFARLHSGEWGLEKSIRLSEVAHDLPGYNPSYFNQPLLIHTTDSPVIHASPWQERPWWFHLDIETTEVAPAPDPSVEKAYPCELPWPPTLEACTEQLLDV
ncbi:hypothetical protein ACP70R_006645 [Stipagrostis hirtigluma subsp. patula]